MIVDNSTENANNKPPQEPTIDEILQAAEILSRIPEGNPLNRILFTEIARLVTSPIIEFVPLKIIEGKINVLLIPRESDDPLWPSMLHTPGTAIRPSDESLIKPLQRLLGNELADTDIISIDYAGIQLHHTDRGSELAHIFYGEVDEFSLGTYYPVDELPENIISSQLPMIKAVVSEYAVNRNIAIPVLPNPEASIIKLMPVTIS